MYHFNLHSVAFNQRLTISGEMGELSDMFEQRSSWSCCLLSATSVDKLAGDIAPLFSSFCSQSICKLGLWLLFLPFISSSSCWICCKKSRYYFWVVWQILAPLNPIPTSCCHVMLIYGLILPVAGRNRVKVVEKK